MIIQSLNELQPVKRRTVIINYNTKASTLLAALSAQRYAKIPVLIIECESTDGSFELFKKYSFDVIKAPLKDHGATLDWLFSEISGEQLLLIDSDLEILNEEIISFMYRYIEKDEVFASGLTNGNLILSTYQGRLKDGYYCERPFMPLVLFKVKYAKEALKNNVSFLYQDINNDFSLVNRRRGVSRICRIFNINPLHFRKSYYEHKSKMIVYDTGAKMYEYLKYKRHLHYVGIPDIFQNEFVCHAEGGTRHTRFPWGGNKGNLSLRLDEHAIERLRAEYNVSV